MTMQSKKQFKNQAQDGRSMVEMLGVLAIIAVLSIGGIIGFRLAMNYYQANQIAHEMNIMRTDAQIKIAQGAEELTLGDPYDSGNIQFNGYKTDFDCLDMETETSTPDKVVFCAVANAYYIELQEIPEGVCKPLANLIDNMDNEIAFYINDKSVDAAEGEKGACSEGLNTLKVIFGADSKVMTPETTITEIKCTKYTDCGLNEYCYFYNSDNCIQQTGYGTCKNNRADTMISVNKKTFIAKKEWMTWWSAKDFCNSHGKIMASISGLGCADSIVQGTIGYCHQETVGNTNYNSHNISNTVTELQKKLGNNDFWLQDMYDSSCKAYDVYLNYGNIDPQERNNLNAVLCE